MSLPGHLRAGTPVSSARLTPAWDAGLSRDEAFGPHEFFELRAGIKDQQISPYVGGVSIPGWSYHLDLEGESGCIFNGVQQVAGSNSVAPTSRGLSE